MDVTTGTDRSWLVFAAGSIMEAMVRAMAAFRAADGGEAGRLVGGPAGWLHGRILSAERPDLYLSASPAGPTDLVDRGLCRDLRHVCGNRLVVIARPGLEISEATLVDRLLDPGLTIGTSTPLTDPAGDYALAVLSLLFERFPGRRDPRLRRREVVGQPGAREAGRQSPLVAAIATGQADLFFSYATTLPAVRRVLPRVTSVEVPTALAPEIRYTMALGMQAAPAAERFADWFLGPAGGLILEEAGFLLP
ncbi:substrate-binding domain-containing protein [Breoghania sp. JC706]|uniref:substrate-binding domain-containing protein n=1 Tax=Breoghania sp. JC706 TaxID=3117732 RepID=UPI00300AAEA4